MNKKYFFFWFLIFSIIICAHSQSGFRFNDKKQKKQVTSFKLIHNLIVIPIAVNGKKLSFILDTGVSKTILFQTKENDSTLLLRPKEVFLRGLGAGLPIAAVLSKGNHMSVQGLVAINETVFAMEPGFFDVSSKTGIPIHGIIGHALLKNIILKINYKRKKINFYAPESAPYDKCRKCEILPIQFYGKKPYVNIQVQLDTIGKQMIPVKMLLDSGGTDALWLFEDFTTAIKTPIKYFNDILGEGLSGVIYGNRSRIPKLKIGSFEIKKPTVSFLDTTSTRLARRFKARNGSLGGGVLKRFTVWLDYPNKQVMLKKNSSFKAPFYYNMSGLDIVYNGKQLVEEFVPDISSYRPRKNNLVAFSTTSSYNFKPSYKIKTVVKTSSAGKAGLKAGDLIIRINNKPASDYSLNDIISEFSEKGNKRIRMKIKRLGVEMSFKFRLEKKI